MAQMASIDALLSAPHLVTAAQPAMLQQAAFRRRQVTPETGRAIETLGHAIEYLADEFAAECRSRDFMPAGKHARVMAIELLMARNREIYLNCPVAPTLADRLRSFLHLQRV